ncbi:MAG: hypothetical protein FJ317_06595, partial [SAR202 cluster bacterium]|nr:hypothetical protein [SAR202 cluster bacterium]
MDIRFKSGFAFTLMAAVAVAAACGQPVASQQGIGPARIPTPHTQVVRVPTTQATGAEANFTVVYRDGVFEPGRLDIKEGETVRFVNESGVEVWPASHIHPTHQIYPEFDPGAAIPPGGSWEFTFDQSGYWRYHNHVEASETGLVVVLGTGGSSGEAIAIKNESPTFQALGIVSLQDAINLFRDDVLLATYIERYGPDVTIRVLSENERVVGGDCHQRAHSVGRIAYEKFGALAFSLSGHECHSGGYHGAMEALFRERGTVNLEADISAVCGGGLNTFFRHQCVHGVGHGLMAWTSYELFDSLKLCDILDTTNDKTSCYTGVFMENVVGGLAGSMGHTTDYLSEDPHYPCDVLDPEYVPYCYYYQTSRMVQLF